MIYLIEIKFAQKYLNILMAVEVKKWLIWKAKTCVFKNQCMPCFCNIINKMYFPTWGLVKQEKPKRDQQVNEEN